MKYALVAVSIAALLVGVVAVAGGVTAGPAAEVSRPEPPNCERLLEKQARGAAAVEALGNKLPKVAELNGQTTKKLRATLRSDESLWVDPCGILFYAERDEIPVDPPETAPTLVFPAEQTFQLNSRPASSRVIYIDFDGELVAGTAWNASFNNGQDFGAPAFDIDGSPSTFSNDERAIIQNVWLRVAEDFAPFDVNVTTQNPGLAAIDRTGSTDAAYGTRALVTAETVVSSQCGCAGIAYVGVYDAPASHQYYQPALVFQRGTGSNSKVIGEVVSHEVGHNLGLSHDGTSVAAYYSGQGPWAPIMGTGYNRPITQWSRGEYAGANNVEDDYAVMQSNGASLRADDVANTQAGATPLQSGVKFDGRITTSTDVDWFTFSGTGEVTINATVASTSPNLDVQLDLYDGTGVVLTTGDPPAQTVSGDFATGLSATLSRTLASPGTYYVSVRGVGYGDPASTGYSRYAAVGPYSITATVSDPNTGPTITNSALPTGVHGVPYSATIGISGGVAPYTYGLTAQSAPLPADLRLSSSTGEITGIPNAAAGTYAVSFKVIDSQGRSSTKSLPITLTDPALTITSSIPLPPASYLVPYSMQMTAKGGRSGYTWSLASGTIPAGLTLGANGVLSGTPSRKSTYSFTVRATSGTASVTKALSMTITDPLKVTTTVLADATVGVAYGPQLSGSGGFSPYVWEIDPQLLPPGLELSANKIVGTPTEKGQWSFDVRVTDAVGRTASKTLSIAAYKVSIATGATLPAAMRGKAYSTTFAADGGKGPYDWGLVSGTLPTGLSLDGSTGVISGTTQMPGTYSFVIEAKDDASRVATKPITLVVEQDPDRPYVTNKSLPVGSVTKPYSAQLTAVSGPGHYVWSLASGTLPAGLTLSTDGLLSGTPTTATSYSFTVRVTSGSAIDTKAFVVPVTAPVAVSTASLLNGTVGTSYSMSLVATGGTRSYVWSIDSGTLPAGLTVASGKISGTPTTRGTFTIILRVTDTAGRFALTNPLTLNVYQVVITTGASLPAATKSQAYSLQLVAEGGVAPYVWSRSSGSLPSGLTLSSAGVISGTPTVTGTFTYTVKVTDFQRRVATKVLTIVVAL